MKPKATSTTYVELKLLCLETCSRQENLTLEGITKASLEVENTKEVLTRKVSNFKLCIGTELKPDRKWLEGKIPSALF